MSDELASEESIQDSKRRMNTICVVDHYLCPCSSKNGSKLGTTINEMLHSCLSSIDDDIKDLCEYYDIDTPVVVRELIEL